jgi:ATP-dependent RNA helicase DeaD
MDTFEDLDLPPELVEALAAEGMDAPTPLQAEVLPVLRRGNSALVRGGSGAGILVAYGVPLLERLEPGGGRPGGLVLTPDEATATRLARSLARLALATGHRVAALGGSFALAGLADVLFATPEDLADALRSGEVKVDGIQILVLAGAAALLDDEDRVGTLLEFLEGRDIQGVAVADPVTPAVTSFVEAHLKRAVFLPSHAGTEGPDEGAPVQRGTLRVLSVDGEVPDQLPRLVGHLLETEARHVLLFFRNEDRAADLGDLLGLHGFLAGAPGDADVPVWLATDAREAREVLDAAGAEEGVVVVSVDVPSDVDELDRRHGGRRGGGIALARPRELAHLGRNARAAGYALEPLDSPPPTGRRAAAELADRLETALEEADLAPYHLLLEPILQRHPAAEVAAALAYLLRRKPTTGAPEIPSRAAIPGAPPGPRRPAAFVRLFLSIGSRDGVGPGDLLGAITGETGIEGDRVGRIDLRDTFSLVEVAEQVAPQVIRALNGISIRGRSVRADYDRPSGGGAERGGAGRRERGGKPPRRGDPPASPRGKGGGGARR